MSRQTVLLSALAVCTLGAGAYYALVPEASTMLQIGMERLLNDPPLPTPSAVDTQKKEKPKPIAKEKTSIDLVVVAESVKQPTELVFVTIDATAEKPVRKWMIALEKHGVARVFSVVQTPTAGAAQDESVPQQFVPAMDLLKIDVNKASEMGLLGIAFHPRFEENGLFYISSNPRGEELFSEISTWHIDPQQLGQGTAVKKNVLLTLKQPYQNHDGGKIAFGRDGYLYIAFGDGGSGGDPDDNGQNQTSFLGKLLRIDVDHPADGKEYSVPTDNPFVGNAAFAPEIWAWGLRNPWKFSFLDDGRVIAADVGQNLYEEIDVIKAGDNLGWNLYEGFHPYTGKNKSVPVDTKTRPVVWPIFEYDHSVGQSITGGYIYKGSLYKELVNQYIFGDFAAGKIWAIDVPAQPPAQPPANKAEAPTAILLGAWDQLYLSTFGQDDTGELYIGNLRDNRIYRLQPRRQTDVPLNQP